MVIAEGRPLILIDVDDVLNLIEFSSAARRHLAFHHGWRRGKAWSEGREYQLIVNPAHGRILRGLGDATGAELAWATTLEEAANRYVAPLLGLPQLPTVVPAPVGGKAAHVVPWTAGRPFVWLDNDEIELATAERLTRDKGQPHLGVRVDPAIGLTARNVELARGSAAWSDDAVTVLFRCLQGLVLRRRVPGAGRFPRSGSRSWGQDRTWRPSAVGRVPGRGPHRFAVDAQAREGGSLTAEGRGLRDLADRPGLHRGLLVDDEVGVGGIGPAAAAVAPASRGSPGV